MTCEHTEREAMTSNLELTVQDTPGMTAPLPWRVFKVNDCDWYIARTLEEAIATWVRDTGWNDCDDFEDARELSEAELDRLKFIEDRELPREDWVRRTFREELDRRSASGAPEDRKPGMFASTEY